MIQYDHMSSVTVEVGHTYAPDELLPLSHGIVSSKFPIPVEYKPEYLIERIEHAERLHRLASYFGPEITKVALLDEVAVQHKIDALPLSDQKLKWQWKLRESEASLVRGAQTTEVYRESQFEQAGRAIVDHVQTMDLPDGYRLSQDGRKLKTGSGKNMFVVPLQGFNGVDDPTHPSCQVLDVAWLQKRLTLAPEAVTLLPAGYEDQQRGVEILADLIGVDRASYHTVIYDPKPLTLGS